MKPLVIYHANCADGFGAAFAAWLKLGDEAEYLPVMYGAMDLKPGGVFDQTKNYHGGHLFHSDNLRDRDIYIVDFSFSRETMDHLFGHAKRVVWLDHHKTAFEMWCGKYERGMRFSDTNGCYGDGNHDIVLDDNKSGAMIAWEWFHGTDVPMLIKHIDDYDRWQFKLEGTKEFNKALWAYAPWTFEQWRQIHFNLSVDENTQPRYRQILAEGAAILRAHDQNVQSVVKGGARKCKIPNYNVDAKIVKRHEDEWELRYEQAHVEMAKKHALPGLAANCPPFLTSDVGHELANQSGTFGLCWTLNQKTMNANCSLRSNGDYDVSAIAKAFGGGGHKNAAGFEVPILVLLNWIP